MLKLKNEFINRVFIYLFIYLYNYMIYLFIHLYSLMIYLIGESIYCYEFEKNGRTCYLVGFTRTTCALVRS